MAPIFRVGSKHGATKYKVEALNQMAKGERKIRCSKEHFISKSDAKKASAKLHVKIKCSKAGAESDIKRAMLNQLFKG